MPAGYLIKTLDGLYQDKVNKRDPTELKKGIREMDGWMDGWMDDLRFDVLFNSISAGPRSAIGRAPDS